MPIFKDPKAFICNTCAGFSPTSKSLTLLWDDARFKYVLPDGGEEPYTVVVKKTKEKHMSRGRAKGKRGGKEKKEHYHYSLSDSDNSCKSSKISDQPDGSHSSSSTSDSGAPPLQTIGVLHYLGKQTSIYR